MCLPILKLFSGLGIILVNSMQNLTMKFLTAIIIIGLCSLHTKAQNFHLNLFGGVANYQGDLQPKRFAFQQSKLAIGVGGEYEVSPLFWLRTQVTIGQIGADDKKYVQHADRNLNFTSNIQELQLVGQFLFRNLEDYRFTPYVFGGVAGFHFNPYTHDTTGTKYFLKPLSTEGEGFVDGRKNYSLTQFSIPFGGGVKINMSNKFIVGFEMGFRKTFTDYLDDVSTTYVDQNLLLTNKGAKAVELAYRGGELKNGGTYPPDRSLRGGASKKDLYYFAGATLTYRFGSLGGGTDKKNIISCPSAAGL